MKLGDNTSAALPPTVSNPTAPHRAGAWQAQLERAWLDSWQGEQAKERNTANPGGEEARQTPAARSESPERAGPLERGAGAGLRAPERPISSPPGPLNAGGQAVWRGVMVAPAASHVSTRVGDGAVLQSAAAGRAVTAATTGYPRLPADAGGEAALPPGAEAKGGAARDHQPGAAPSRTLLQVAVADGAAQVTLRDPALSEAELSRLPQAMAHQLLQSGLESVRLYVNGRMSQHVRSEHGPSRDHQNPDIGHHADPLHITPLERK